MRIDWARIGASIFAQHREHETVWDALRKSNAGIVFRSDEVIADLKQLMAEDPTQAPLAMALLREAIETRDQAELASHKDLEHTIYSHPLQN